MRVSKAVILYRNFSQTSGDYRRKRDRFIKKEDDMFNLRCLSDLEMECFRGNLDM